MNSSRRLFLKASGLLLGSVPLLSFDKLDTNSDTIRVGLVGCGGRGNGAAMQALRADPHVHIVALADIFPDQIAASVEVLSKIDKNRVHVPAARQFVGFNAYKDLIDSDVDVVLLCSPPNFRPDHFAYAVEAGKHIFCEKPVAVDIPGLKRVMESVRQAKTKELNVVSGFCFRYSVANREVVSRVLRGDIGDVKSLVTFRYGGELTHVDRQPHWSEMEYQLRNWYTFQRYASDMIVEQSIHSVDYMNWIMQNRLPLSVSATGGRQSKSWEDFGNTYDHFAVEYDYGDGVKGVHFCRQQNGTDPRNSVEITGTAGHAEVNIMSNYNIYGSKPYNFSGRHNNMYQTQHDELFHAIRHNEIINDGDFMVNSTLLAIWGKLSAYTGKRITLEQIMNSQETLGPNSSDYSWDLGPDTTPIVRPGMKPLI